jgi:uncharacterized membrane protein
MELFRLFKNDLAREARQWMDDGLISREQAELICLRYGISLQDGQRRTLAYNVLMALGGLFAGLALITLIGANWEEYPRGLRMTGLVLLTLGTQSFAVNRLRQGRRSAAIAIMLLGNLFFGAAIILIAQIYHLGETMAAGVLWWALGTLPFALLMRSAWLMLQTLILALIWLFIQAFTGYAVWIFVPFLVAALWILYQARSALLLFLTTLLAGIFYFNVLLALWWSDSFMPQFHAEHMAVNVLLFMLAWIAAHWMNTLSSERARDYAAVLSLWTLRFALITLFVLSFRDPWRALIDAGWNTFPQMLMLLIPLTTGILWFAFRCGMLPLTGGVLAGFWGVLIGVATSDNTAHALWFQVTANLVLVGMGVNLLLLGIRNGISHYFFLGISTVLLTGLLRYIDLVGDYVGAASLFLVFSLIMLGAAWYWKRFQGAAITQEEAR